MTIESTIGQSNSDPYPDDNRSPVEDRRTIFEQVADDRRSSAGNRQGDFERQLEIIRVMNLNIPNYLLRDMEPGTEHEEAMSQFEAQVAPVRNDKYEHVSFTEATDPELAREAWKIHAEGYHAMGFITDEALTDDGFLAEGIDKSTGPYTDYYMAKNPDQPTDGATLRIINLPAGGTYEDLPAYQVSKESLTEEGVQLLQDLENQDVRLKEIAAMARMRHASPMAVHEIIRNIIQEAEGDDEVWFFSIVSTTYESLVKNLGENSFTVIGADVPIPDDRVNDSVALRPALFRPDAFYDNLAQAYLDAETSTDRAKLKRSILFFSDGMDESRLSDRFNTVRNSIINPTDEVVING